MTDTDTKHDSSHSLLMGYALWLFGFLGAHRFYSDEREGVGYDPSTGPQFS